MAETQVTTAPSRPAGRGALMKACLSARVVSRRLGFQVPAPGAGVPRRDT